MLRIYFKNVFGCNTYKISFAHKKKYDVKRLVLKLGLKAKRIDYCVDGCMLYYNNDGALIKHKTSPSIVPSLLEQAINTPVLVKAMFYLSIIPRLQKMFASMQTASQMTWLYEDKRSLGMLPYPFNGEA